MGLPKWHWSNYDLGSGGLSVEEKGRMVTWTTKENEKSETSNL